MRVPRLSGRLLVTLLALTVLGHICALPFHAHAGAIATQGERTSHHGDGDADGDAIHGASCDVVKCPSASVERPVLAPAGVAQVVATPRPLFPRAAPDLVVRGSPLLFLLHAALLI